MRPKSALYRPDKLTPDEEAAVKLVEQFASANRHLDLLTVPKLKPTLKKKKTNVDKGFRRVTIDDMGKIKEIKEPEPEPKPKKQQ